MANAVELISVLEDPGFSRLRRFKTRAGVERWELWLQDGVLHALDGSTWSDVADQALARIKSRGGRP
jgi:hypothetical protein